MLAAKFYDDQYYNNAYFGKVGGVPCDELNSLEVEFLFMCNFSFSVPPQQYEQYYTELFNHARQANAGCTCHQQRSKIPALVFPLPDAGSKCSDLPPLQEEKDPEPLVIRSPVRISPNTNTQPCALDAPIFGPAFVDSLPTCSS